MQTSHLALKRIVLRMGAGKMGVALLQALLKSIQALGHGCNEVRVIDASLVLPATCTLVRLCVHAYACLCLSAYACAHKRKKVWEAGLGKEPLHFFPYSFF